MADKIKLRSLIKEYFSEDLMLELNKLCLRHDMDTNTKTLLIYKILEEAGVPFFRLGPGTNRVGIQIDGYAVKIALDTLGLMDNRREFKYSPILYPDVIKVYECVSNGLIAVTEYVTVFDSDMFYESQDKIRKILRSICSQYLVGDIGVSKNNYMNWGARDDGSICCLDFAYIYEISSGVFVCDCPAHPMMEYDEDFNLLVCPVCRKKADFIQKRRRISKEEEEREVGDIRELGYVLHKEVEEHEVNPAFSIFRPRDEKEEDEDMPDEVNDAEDQSRILDEMTLEEKLNKINGGN